VAMARDAAIGDESAKLSVNMRDSSSKMTSNVTISVLVPL
jgi:hypothetical protein